MAQIPFSPPQVQAALQNPVRFPDQQLQQYAQRGSPTGQVTPPMAQQEMATRGQERQAFQRQQAMSQNPENSPTIFQQKDMQIQQAMQALQQKEQQLGMMGALMARKAQDVQEREQGIATLPVREDMFTAMNGGIVFRGGGQVQRFNGQKGPSFIEGISPEFGSVSSDVLIEDIFRAEKKKNEKDKVQYEFLKEAAPSVAKRFAEENPHVLETIPRVPSTVEAPSTTKTNKKEDNKASSTTNASSTTGGSSSTGSKTRSPEQIAQELENRILLNLIPTEKEKDVADFAQQQALNLANLRSRMSPEQREAFERKTIQRREEADKPFLEERKKLREEEAAATRPEALTTEKLLGSIVRGLKPGKTLAETLQGGASTAAEDMEKRAEAERAARIKIVQAKLLDNEADRQRKLGNIEKANELADKADEAERQAATFAAGIAEKRTGLYSLAAAPDADKRKGLVQAITSLGIPLIQGASQERVAEKNRLQEAGLRSEENLRRSFREYQETALKYAEKVLPSTLGYDAAQETQRQQIAIEILGQLVNRDPAMKQWLGKQGAGISTTETRKPDFVMDKTGKLVPAK